jgi:hypothetical protein
MRYRLFLDDLRAPTDCVTYMHRRIGKLNLEYIQKWKVVKNYEEFVATVKLLGLPEVVSFDHDLSPDQYGREMDFVSMKEYYETEDREMTGYDCVKWLCDYCRKNELKFPRFYLHTLNPVGRQNMADYIENYKLRNET